MVHVLRSDFRLEPNEVVLFRTQHSFESVLFFLSPLLWLPVAAAMLAAFGPDGLKGYGYASAVLAVFYLLWLGTSHLSASVAITDRRVVARSGITNQDTVEIFHREIDPKSLEGVGRTAGADVRDLFGNKLPLKHIGNGYEICRRLADICGIDSSHIPGERLVSVVRRTVLIQTGFWSVVVLAWVLILRLILDSSELSQLAIGAIFTFAFLPAGLWIGSVIGCLVGAALVPRDLDLDELRQLTIMLLGAGSWDRKKIRKRWGFGLYQRILSNRCRRRIEL
jgi:hypothetical protein